MAAHPHPILGNAPLQTVACEIRFPGAVFVPEDLKAIRKTLKDDYPVSDTQQGVGIEISLESGVRQQSALQRYLYATLDGSHQVGLGAGSLALEARSGYEGFERFLDRWLRIVTAIVPVVDLGVQLRVGLRYVNQLVVEDMSSGLQTVTGRINSALLAPYRTEGFPYGVTTSFQELRLQEDGQTGALRHGLQLAPSATGIGGQPQENAVPRGFYVLDIDFYDDVPKDFFEDEHKEQLKNFNYTIWKIFRWSLTDEEYQRMDPKERSEAS